MRGIEGLTQFFYKTMKTYEITYGSHTLKYAFHYERTPLYMRPYIREAEGEEYDILSPLDYMEYLKPYYPESSDDAYVEYKSLINLTSLKLLSKKSSIFHATAFKYKGKAWLFTGRSGIGKTTQYKNWKIHFRQDISLICGDMPCLEVKSGDKIHVYPSPWNGKEFFKGKDNAPLGGIIFLEKSDHNKIEELSPKDSISPLIHQFAVEPETEEDIKDLSFLADTILSNYPVLKLSNRADEEAVILLSEYLEKYL